MYILILYTAQTLSLQPYYWLSILAIASPIVSFISYVIRKRGGIKADRAVLIEFTYKGAVVSGIFSAINLIMVGYSSTPNRSPQDFQAIASQLTVPATMIASAVFIRRYPSRLQLLSTFLVMGGVAVAIVPGLQNPSFAGQPVWMAVFVVGNAVQGPQATLMEHSMKSKWDKKVVVDGFFATASSGLWSAVFFFAALPLNFWPTFSQTNEEEFWNRMSGAWSCTVHGSDPANPSASALCDTLWIVLSLLVLVVALWNAVAAEMEAQLGANYTQIANCLGGVLAAFYYNIKVLARDIYEPFSWFNVLAVVLMVVGTFGYKYFDKARGQPHDYTEIEHKRTIVDFLMITKCPNNNINIDYATN